MKQKLNNQNPRQKIKHEMLLAIGRKMGSTVALIEAETTSIKQDLTEFKRLEQEQKKRPLIFLEEEDKIPANIVSEKIERINRRWSVTQKAAQKAREALSGEYHAEVNQDYVDDLNKEIAEEDLKIKMAGIDLFEASIGAERNPNLQAKKRETLVGLKDNFLRKLDNFILNKSPAMHQKYMTGQLNVSELDQLSEDDQTFWKKYIQLKKEVKEKSDTPISTTAPAIAAAATSLPAPAVITAYSQVTPEPPPERTVRENISAGLNQTRTLILNTAQSAAAGVDRGLRKLSEPSEATQYQVNTFLDKSAEASAMAANAEGNADQATQIVIGASSSSYPTLWQDAIRIRTEEAEQWTEVSNLRKKESKLWQDIADIIASSGDKHSLQRTIAEAESAAEQAAKATKQAEAKKAEAIAAENAAREAVAKSTAAEAAVAKATAAEAAAAEAAAAKKKAQEEENVKRVNAINAQATTSAALGTLNVVPITEEDVNSCPNGAQTNQGSSVECPGGSTNAIAGGQATELANTSTAVAKIFSPGVARPLGPLSALADTLLRDHEACCKNKFSSASDEDKEKCIVNATNWSNKLKSIGNQEGNKITDLMDSVNRVITPLEMQTTAPSTQATINWPDQIVKCYYELFDQSFNPLFSNKKLSGKDYNLSNPFAMIAARFSSIKKGLSSLKEKKLLPSDINDPFIQKRVEIYDTLKNDAFKKAPEALGKSRILFMVDTKKKLQDELKKKYFNLILKGMCDTFIQCVAFNKFYEHLCPPRHP
ncbi:MAG: hypothetical protein HQK53_05705 [Oligoflexia bacterium]|nr:hypothetical protein [Oligoflexia bacterium]